MLNHDLKLDDIEEDPTVKNERSNVDEHTHDDGICVISVVCHVIYDIMCDADGIEGVQFMAITRIILSSLI